MPQPIWLMRISDMLLSLLDGDEYFSEALMIAVANTEDAGF